MKRFKDPNNNDQPHEIEEGFEHLLPEGCVEIDQTEFDTLTAPVPETVEEANTRKDAQVAMELGGDNIRILVDVFKEIVTDGTISSKTPDQIIAQAMTKRRNELNQQ